MARFVRGLLLSGLMLMMSGTLWAADDPVAGIYKVTILTGPGQQSTLWLLKLESKDGKAWSGETISLNERIPKAEVNNLSVKDGVIRLTFKPESGKFPFEGKLGGDGKKILGSMPIDRLYAAQLELTGLKELDSYAYAKELFAQSKENVEVVDAAMSLLNQAGEKNAKPDEVRAWASKAVKAAESFGPRYHLESTLRVADALAAQEAYSAIALQYARQAERLLSPAARPGTQRHVLTLLASLLKTAGKEDDAKEIEAKVAKLEPVVVSKFPGRQKGNQVVLVELFTGADCPPCVAADLAFEALGKTYKPTEVILLQYHLHIPGPDPLTNADSNARADYFRVESTPAVLCNGKVAGTRGGGPTERAQDKYEEFVDAIEPLLDQESKVSVKTSAVSKDGKIVITATVTSAEKPDDKVRLRFALVEDEVKYVGGNKLKTHHHVVRAMPGGAEGFPLSKDKITKKSVTVDLAELRKQLNTYLDDFSKQEEFKWKDKPLELKKLRVVAFVENDANKEVLQADEAEVKAAE